MMPRAQMMVPGCRGRRTSMETPAHFDDLTAEWLTDALRTTGVLMQASVTSLKVQGLGAEKGMTGNLARLHLAYDTDEPDAPHSLIAKVSAGDPQLRAHLRS